MSIKGAKTIAEYTIRKWLSEQGFVMEYFSLSMEGSRGILTDGNNDTLILVYDSDTKSVSVTEN
ncbi:hypothetical protein D5282_25195 [bacterium 1xD8-48]|nr:hypothetical protein [bacterium 1xD8-48]